MSATGSRIRGRKSLTTPFQVPDGGLCDDEFSRRRQIHGDVCAPDLVAWALEGASAEERRDFVDEIRRARGRR